MKIQLRPIEDNSDQEPEKFAVCDIETMNWKDFLCIGYYDGEHFWWWKTMEEFVDTIEEVGCKICYAHFGGKFDFMFVLQSMVPNRRITIEKIIPRGSGLLCFDAVFHNEKGEQTHRCSFRDSSALLPFGLRALTESFGVEHIKQEWDHSKTTGVTPALINYLHDDCRGLYEVIEKFQNWPLVRKAGSAFTMAGQAVKVFRTFLEKPIESLDEEQDEFTRGAYVGGRTEIFKPLFMGNKNKKIYCYDVNSLYPHIMQSHEFPTNWRCTTYEYFGDELGYYDAAIKVPKMAIPPLATYHEVNGTIKTIYPTGTLKGRWSTAEIEYAKSLGCEVLWTGRGDLYENGGYIFKEFIDTLYSMRLKAKAEGDGVGDILTKLIMNSTYGRFGLNRNRENIVFDEGQLDVELFHELNMKGHVVRLMKEKTQLKTSFSNVGIAAWVTANARILMHKLFMQCPDEIYYTDTDSLFTTHEFEDSKELGALKKEYDCEQACFLLPKTYILQSSDQKFSGFNEKTKKWENEFTNTKLTMKGFDRKKIGNFTFDDFFSALEGDLRRLKVTHDAKFATFKSAIKQDTFVAMLPESTKQIRSLYDKRNIVRMGKHDFSTTPIEVNQWPYEF